MKAYRPRLIEDIIRRRLDIIGTILITGPKYCGKTTTSMQFQKSLINLSDDKQLQKASYNLDNILEGNYPILIDEWQRLPQIWDKIRNLVDQKPKKGMFILSGSSTPTDPSKIFHSGAGRISRIVMRPMSLWESQESFGYVSLMDLFDNKPVLENYFENENYSIYNTLFYMCRGGWPEAALEKDKKKSMELTDIYIDNILNFGLEQNKSSYKITKQILKDIVSSYARNISSEAAITTITNDVIYKDENGINHQTIRNYLETLYNLFILEELQAWSPNFRSSIRMRTKATHHFVDTSVACNILKATPELLAYDKNTTGLLFEDFVIRDLRIYAESIGAEVSKYKESNGLECDAIITLRDGRVGLVEIKLGDPSNIEVAAKSLNKVYQRFVDQKDLTPLFRPPVFKMIVTAYGAGYKRNDGIYVVPINILKN
ncbi:ATP-binding protein [[Mycoplasma] testudinis]|uniref:ATP-binding protein n=1 Tax=[Mycoplasma] testudinis TaxID=33924 RepID=UPI0004867F7A|nr:AAA family ATPase [[Mycoplasma] testudinis]